VVLVIDNRDGSSGTDDPNGWCDDHGGIVSHETRRLAAPAGQRPQRYGALTANLYMNMNPARAESVGIWVGYEYEYEYIPARINDSLDMNMNISSAP
jgi:hypothetical protein